MTTIKDSTQPAAHQIDHDPARNAASIGAPMQRVHHYAAYCRDAEETRHFYEDLLGLPLVHALRVENMPSSGVRNPYMHLFFEMEDKSCLAFFDILEGPNHPGMTAPHPWTNHIAVRVSSREILLQAKEKLQEAGVEVVGPIDHEFVESIYFQDPNGINLELTIDTADAAYMQHERDTAHANLQNWAREKKQAVRQAN